MVRDLVPARLHAEISEYASLLRALHTSDSLDVAARLTARRQHQPVIPDADPDHQREDDAPPIATGSKAGPTNRRSQTTATQEAPISTRWPLLPEDVPTPPWTLEDELRVLATHVLTHTDSEPQNDDPSSEDPSIDALFPALTHACTAHLTHILALLALHVPRSENSMQGRIAPMTWESVLDILGVRGACDIQSIENVQRRLEAIYGPSENRVVPNVDFKAISDRQFKNACTAEAMDFLTFPPQPESDGSETEEEEE